MEKLSVILKNIEEFKWSDALFLPEDEIWEKDTEGMVLDPNDVEDDEDDVPREAKEKRLMYTLGIQTIQSVVRNLKQQEHDISEVDLVAAFLYYYENDAYMAL